MEAQYKQTVVKLIPDEEVAEGDDHFFPPIHFPLTKRLLMRSVDLCVATTVLTLCFPVMLAIGIIIRWDSRGPALFRQVRIGQNRRRRKTPSKGVQDRRQENLLGSPFVFYKFRTMYVDARERWPELYEYDYSDDEIKKIKFKLDNDPRLTKVGRFLRRSTLDELPNFINVLIGNMTLVGPRPDIPEMMKYYEPWHIQKFQVKPGITGLAQVEGRGHLSFRETLDKDVRYVRDQSFALDLKILLTTIKAILTGDGAF